jgi:F0F1-type ATP synthase assembly protein I
MQFRVSPSDRRAIKLTAVGLGQSLHLERKPATFPEDDRRRVERKYLQFAGVGVQFAAIILVLTLAGIWLDERVGTAPIFTVVFLLLAFVGATWSLVHQVLGPGKPDKPGKPEQNV